MADKDKDADKNKDTDKDKETDKDRETDKDKNEEYKSALDLEEVYKKEQQRKAEESKKADDESKRKSKKVDDLKEPPLSSEVPIDDVRRETVKPDTIVERSKSRASIKSEIKQERRESLESDGKKPELLEDTRTPEDRRHTVKIEDSEERRRTRTLGDRSQSFKNEESGERHQSRTSIDRQDAESKSKSSMRPSRYDLNAGERDNAEKLQEIRRSIDTDLKFIRRRTQELEEDKQKIEDAQKQLNRDKWVREKGSYKQFGFYDKPKKKKFKQFLYDPEDKKCLGRTWRAWLRFLIFYLIFFASLAALFTICIQTYLRSIQPKNAPLDSEWVMSQPGLTIFPADAYGMSLGSKLSKDIDKKRVNDAMGKNKINLDSMDTSDGKFIWDRNRVGFRNRLEFMFKRFLEPYENRQDLVEFGNCTKENLYGFLNNTPCFFLKINRIHNFRFKTYKTFHEIPGDFPLKLRERLGEKMDEIGLEGKVFVDCEPTKTSRYKLGDIAYWPELQTVDVKNYFYSGAKQITKQNLMPLVTIQLLNPRLWTPLGLVCKIWAKNIQIVDDTPPLLLGAAKLYFNIKDSKITANKGGQKEWEIMEFPN